MSLAMTRSQREAFLADVHVGVIAIERPGRPPLAVPIWYDYTADRGIRVITDVGSPKAVALEAAGRFALVAQDETPPSYRYVSVEGPIVAVEDMDVEAHLRPMARRYLGEALGDLYVKDRTGEGSRVYTMRPERWRTIDYGRLALG